MSNLGRPSGGLRSPKTLPHPPVVPFGDALLPAPGRPQVKERAPPLPDASSRSSVGLLIVVALAHIPYFSALARVLLAGGGVALLSGCSGGPTAPSSGRSAAGSPSPTSCSACCRSPCCSCCWRCSPTCSPASSSAISTATPCSRCRGTSTRRPRAASAPSPPAARPAATEGGRRRLRLLPPGPPGRRRSAACPPPGRPGWSCRPARLRVTAAGGPALRRGPRRPPHPGGGRLASGRGVVALYTGDFDGEISRRSRHLDRDLPLGRSRPRHQVWRSATARSRSAACPQGPAGRRGREASSSGLSRGERYWDAPLLWWGEISGPLLDLAHRPAGGRLRGGQPERHAPHRAAPPLLQRRRDRRPRLAHPAGRGRSCSSTSTPPRR